MTGVSALANISGSKKKLSVAVIGGGISGLSCAQHLKEGGNFDPVVFDTGRLRPGGRCSSRLPGDLPKDQEATASRNTILGAQVIDHAAQILTATMSKPFVDQVRKWEEDGVLARFPAGSVMEVGPRPKKGVPVSKFLTKGLNADARDPVMYFGAEGMGSIAGAIANNAGLQIEQDVWVSPSNGVKYVGGKDGGKPRWRIKAKGQVLGEFDRLVIAHNGKCADRLMSKTPAKKLHSLLRTNFASSVPAHGGDRMTLNSIYSLVFAVDKNSPLSRAIPEDMITAFIKNEPKLRLISSNTRKFRKRGSSSTTEIFTVLSSPQFAKKNKAPQENIPTEVAGEVTSQLLQAVEVAFCLEKGSLSGDNCIRESKLQLWGAAVPLNTWSDTPGFVFDDDFGVGACGDWLLDPSMEGAWESGRRLANWMNQAEVGGKKSSSVGLPPFGKFKRSAASMDSGIGSFGSSPTSVPAVK
eukprot:CAMPEP_0196824210 /NCGR_PEP_ID=MMETSP1362-20130617/90899_1 /TAXON_ID=163516 /ORGANISM="Leptocylindrus danicus, Strain CCMP1856" /LENGTH=467 /DNA_ID=CAMNT_0042204389 /DNA_START=44 /DNA_END=1447 /DNA_ORIENTATION=+